MLDLIRNRTHAELGTAGARIAAEAISRAHEQGREATVLLAAAPSQLPVLQALTGADIHARPVRYFHMDEYVGLEPGAPQAFGRWLEDNYFARLPEGNRATFERIPASGAPQETASAYAAALPAGDFDLVLCGIGINGHLAFNDPGADLEDPEPVRYIELAEASRAQQVDEGLFPALSAVPRYAITLTVPRILASRTVVCSVLGAAKAEAMKAMLENAVTDQVPATALKNHSDVTVVADLEALSRVE
ncbi:6-phosphogluconolactonase [Georgenia sp. MJ173]|uniref:6-phosphogluconolactonase n=1 Tax=Georgenia sunbinii TaxID=3117728 RepID=UPI002F2676EB